MDLWGEEAEEISSHHIRCLVRAVLQFVWGRKTTQPSPPLPCSTPQRSNMDAEVIFT